MGITLSTHHFGIISTSITFTPRSPQLAASDAETLPIVVSICNFRLKCFFFLFFCFFFRFFVNVNIPRNVLSSFFGINLNKKKIQQKPLRTRETKTHNKPTHSMKKKTTNININVWSILTYFPFELFGGQTTAKLWTKNLTKRTA